MFYEIYNERNKITFFLEKSLLKRLLAQLFITEKHNAEHFKLHFTKFINYD